MNRRKIVRSLKRTVCILAGAVLVAGCEFEEPDISNLSGFKMKKIDGKHIEAEFSVDCDNPNGFGFKMKKANIDVLIADQKMGTITLDEKIKVRRKSKNTYTVPVSLDLENGALLKLMQLSLKNEVTVQFQGKVRGSVYGISKSIDVNETRTIDGSILQMTPPE
jgi:LEA14-like dessication related protein